MLTRPAQFSELLNSVHGPNRAVTLDDGLMMHSLEALTRSENSLRLILGEQQSWTSLV